MAAADTHEPDQRPARVLVVDDEDSITQLVATVLRYEGFEVACAGDGKSAVRTARSFDPDLVVLDVMLPGVDGFDVCRAIKEDPETSSIPVVLLTAKKGTQDQEMGRAVGADAYITKPFKSVKVLEVIEGLLRSAATGKPA